MRQGAKKRGRPGKVQEKNLHTSKTTIVSIILISQKETEEHQGSPAHKQGQQAISIKAETERRGSQPKGKTIGNAAKDP